MVIRGQYALLHILQTLSNLILLILANVIVPQRRVRNLCDLAYLAVWKFFCLRLGSLLVLNLHLSCVDVLRHSFHLISHH